MKKILIINAISYIEQLISTVRWVTVYPLLIYFSQGKCDKRVILSQSSLGSSHDLQPLFCPPSLLCGPNCLRSNLLCLVVATLLSQRICHCWQKICRLSICNYSKFSSCTEVLPSNVWGGTISLMRSPELWLSSQMLALEWMTCQSPEGSVADSVWC